MPVSVACVAFNLPVNKVFDYSIPPDMTVEPGMRVWAEFNRTSVVGVVIAVRRSSPVTKLKPLLAALDRAPMLGPGHLKFAARLAEEYPYSLGELVFTMIPSLFKRKRFMKGPVFPRLEAPACADAEITCLRRCTSKDRFDRYSEKIRAALEKGSVVICFPLVAQVERAKVLLEKEFPGKCAVFHSYQKNTETLQNWERSRAGKTIVLGTRMAFFYYPGDTCLFIIEDENNPCYFHPEKPFYHLLDVILLCSRVNRVPLVISSDYPSLETYKLIRGGAITLDDEQEKIKPLELLSARDFIFRKNSFVINPLVTEVIRKSLENNKKVLVLYNRRGFSTYLRCSHCGRAYRCEKCSAPLGFSLKEKKAVCFRCGYKGDIPPLCPQCRTGYIKSYGTGIERVESLLQRVFPSVPVGLYGEGGAKSRIVLSTYAFMDDPEASVPGVDVAVMLDSDEYLSRIDYEATLRLFLYLRRLVRMAGEKVYAVTENSGHYLWESVNRPWKVFYESEAVQRKEAVLPPYVHSAAVTVRGRDEKGLSTLAGRIYNKIGKREGLQAYGPVAGIPFKAGQYYHYVVIVKSENKRLLHDVITKVTGTLRRGTIRVAVEMR